MSWYKGFNLTEAVLWWIVAIAILTRVPRRTRQQRWGAILGATAFFAFGITDVIEAGHERWIPPWLWGFKCACGAGILSARYTWLGWSRFRWTDREFLFGLACLLAVIFLIFLQYRNVPDEAGQQQTFLLRSYPESRRNFENPGSIVLAATF